MPGITIACPECDAKLKLADRAKLGKKMKCPKCEEVFVAKADDEDDDNDEEDEEDEKPRGKKQAAAASGKKGVPPKRGKGKSKSGGNLGLIIGGAVGAVVILLGGLIGILFATGVLGGGKVDPNQMSVNPNPGDRVFERLLKGGGPVPPRGPVPDAARWLPADTEFIVHLRVADALAAPLVKDILKSMQLESQVDQAAELLGWKPAEIESVTIGVAKLEQAQQQIQQAQLGVMLGRTAVVDVPALMVIQLKKPVTYDELVKVAERMTAGQPLEKLSHAGKNYLQSKAPGAAQPLGVGLVSETLVVLGDGNSLKTVLEKGANSTPVPSFGFIDWTDQLSLAVAPKDPKLMQKPPGGSGNPMLDQMSDTFTDGATGYSVGLTVKGGVEAEFAAGCRNQAKMDAIVKALNDLIGLAKLQYDQGKKDLPPWAAALTDQLITNVKVSGSNRVALATTSLPDSSQEQLAQVPAMIMTQIMLNGMLGGPPTTQPPATKSPGDSPGNDQPKE